MPRKTDILAEEAAVASPLRRSSRITSLQSQGEASEVKAKDSTEKNEKPARKGRRASASKEETDQKSAPVRSRRSSATSESGVEEHPKAQTVSKRRGSANSEDSETAKPVKSRRNSSAEEEAAAKKPIRTRRSSAKDDEPKEEPVKRVTRSRRSSADSVEEVKDKKPAARGRKASTETPENEPELKAIKLTPVKPRRRPSNSVNLEPIEELETEVKGRKSCSPPDLKKEVSVNLASAKAEVKANLSTIRETSFMEDSQEESPRRSPRLNKVSPGGSVTSSQEKNKSVTHHEPMKRKLEFTSTEELEDETDTVFEPEQADAVVNDAQLEHDKQGENSKRTSQVGSCGISTGTDGSRINLIDNPDELNGSRLSNGSNKENIEVNSSYPLKKVAAGVKEKVVNSLFDTPVGEKIAPQPEIVVRISDVFRPGNRECSFTEPMEVDEYSLLESRQVEEDQSLVDDKETEDAVKEKFISKHLGKVSSNGKDESMDESFSLCLDESRIAREEETRTVVDLGNKQSIGEEEYGVGKIVKSAVKEDASVESQVELVVKETEDDITITCTKITDGSASASPKSVDLGAIAEVRSGSSSPLQLGEQEKLTNISEGEPLRDKMVKRRSRSPTFIHVDFRNSFDISVEESTGNSQIEDKVSESRKSKSPQLRRSKSPQLLKEDELQVERKSIGLLVDTEELDEEVPEKVVPRKSKSPLTKQLRCLRPQDEVKEEATRKLCDPRRSKSLEPANEDGGTESADTLNEKGVSVEESSNEDVEGEEAAAVDAQEQEEEESLIDSDDVQSIDKEVSMNLSALGKSKSPQRPKEETTVESASALQEEKISGSEQLEGKILERSSEGLEASLDESAEQFENEDLDGSQTVTEVKNPLAWDPSFSPGGRNLRISDIEKEIGRRSQSPEVGTTSTSAHPENEPAEQMEGESDTEENVLDVTGPEVTPPEQAKETSDNEFDESGNISSRWARLKTSFENQMRKPVAWDLNVPAEPTEDNSKVPLSSKKSEQSDEYEFSLSSDEEAAAPKRAESVETTSFVATTYSVISTSNTVDAETKKLHTEKTRPPKEDTSSDEGSDTSIYINDIKIGNSLRNTIESDSDEENAYRDAKVQKELDDMDDDFKDEVQDYEMESEGCVVVFKESESDDDTGAAAKKTESDDGYLDPKTVKIISSDIRSLQSEDKSKDSDDADAKKAKKKKKSKNKTGLVPSERKSKKSKVEKDVLVEDSYNDDSFKLIDFTEAENVAPTKKSKVKKLEDNAAEKKVANLKTQKRKSDENIQDAVKPKKLKKHQKEDAEADMETVIVKTKKKSKTSEAKSSKEETTTTEKSLEADSANSQYKKTKPKDSTSKQSTTKPLPSHLDDILSTKIKEYEALINEEEYTDEVEENADEPCEYVYTMAEEGEEDTPSEGSNDIVDEGESINSTETEYGSSDEEYENDSFVCDDEEQQLLSGEEYDLSDHEQKRKKSRIIQLDDYDDDIIRIPRKAKTATPPKKKSRIIVIPDSSDEEDQAQQEKDVAPPADLDEKEEEHNQTLELALENAQQQTERRRLSSITIKENIDVKEIKDANLSRRISNLLDNLRTTMPRSAELSMNLSIECSSKDAEAPTKQESSAEEESPAPRLSVSVSEAQLKKKRKRRRLSKSMEDLHQTEAASKKRRRKKKTQVDSPLTEDDLRAQSLGLMNRLITDVRNRPRRYLQPSISSASGTWISEVVEVKPSITAFDEREKAAYKAGKVHLKDFRSQMLNDPSRVRRIDTKTLLRKKGCFCENAGIVYFNNHIPCILFLELCVPTTKKKTCSVDRIFNYDFQV